MRALVFALTLALAPLAAGCGVVGEQMNLGTSAYERGDYPAAMNAWNELNGLEDDMGETTRIRYLIYRGLTYYALGVRTYARMYLSRGRTEYQERKATFLDEKTQEEVDRALTDLLHNDP